MSQLSLTVDGQQYGGWKSVTVKQSMKSISGSFQITAINRWPNQKIPWGIKPGNACVVRMDKDKVITGYVDSIDLATDVNARSITVSGRDTTADFVDCSAVDKRYLNITLDKLAQAIAAPFKVPVRMIGDPGKEFLIFNVAVGETAHAALERACRLRGFLLTTDGHGSLVIKRPSGTPSTSALEEGVNVVSASVKYDNKDRFSNYMVLGQRDNVAEQISTSYRIQGLATDPATVAFAVGRYRPLSVSAEAALSTAEAGIRAQWEATVRAGKAAVYKARVQGWRQQDGSLWRPDILTRFKSNFFGVNRQLLLTEVDFSLDASGGEIADLTLERPDAFQLDPTVKEKQDPLETALIKDGRGK